MNLAEAGDGGHKRRLQLAAETTHPGNGQCEGGGHVLPGHVAGSEDKLADGVLLESAFFEDVVANALIGGE